MLTRRSLSRGAFALAALVAAGGFVMAPAAHGQANPQITIAVPAYFKDGAEWDRVLATDAVGWVIGHPDTPADGNYKNEKELSDRLAAAKAKGKKTLIYVTAGYDKVSAAQVADRVDSALTAYPGVDGVFLDEILYNECDKYKALAVGSGSVKGIKARNPGKLVILNPGAPILSCYKGVADGYLNLERGDAAVKEWLDNVNLPGNYSEYNWMFGPDVRSQIWQMVHTVPADRMAAAADDAISRNASVLFLTPEALPNPYDNLPSVAAWTAFVNRVNDYNAGKASLPKVLSLKAPANAAQSPVATKAPTVTTKKPAVVGKKKTTKKRR
jgi:hypothetical protein